MSRRRSSTGVTDFLSDLVDDIKDFLDDEVIDRGRDTERDLRRTGRNWTDSDDDRGRRTGSRRSGRTSRSGSRGSGDRDVEELARAVRALARKIESLEADAGSGTGSVRGSEPWPGYDDQTVADISKRLSSADDATMAKVGKYEAAHKKRQGVLEAIQTD